MAISTTLLPLHSFSGVTQRKKKLMSFLGCCNSYCLYPYLKGHHDYITELINQNNITNQYNDVIDDYNVLAVINQKK